VASVPPKSGIEIGATSPQFWAQVPQISDSSFPPLFWASSPSREKVFKAADRKIGGSKKREGVLLKL